MTWLLIISIDMFTLLWYCLLFSVLKKIDSHKQGLIVGGELASIKVFPHSAHLKIRCFSDEGRKSSWMCGSSVLNQRLLITAAHCVSNCNHDTHIVISLGDENKETGIMRTSSGFLIHAKFQPVTYDSDIALVKMSRPVTFSRKLQRVAVLRNPPYKEMAHIAGWGAINDKKETPIDLKTLTQKVWKHVECKNKFRDLPRGSICASSPYNETEYAAEGDSGSGLMVREYILIGVVSYKSPNVDKSVVMYTDIGYYYDWIMHNSHRLYCFSDTLG